MSRETMKRFCEDPSFHENKTKSRSIKIQKSKNRLKISDKAKIKAMKKKGVVFTNTIIFKGCP